MPVIYPQPRYARGVTDADILNLVTHIMNGETADFVARTADLFLCEDICEMNAGGPHLPKPQCGEVVCVHCARVFP